MHKPYIAAFAIMTTRQCSEQCQYAITANDGRVITVDDISLPFWRAIPTCHYSKRWTVFTADDVSLIFGEKCQPVITADNSNVSLRRFIERLQNKF